MLAKAAAPTGAKAVPVPTVDKGAPAATATVAAELTVEEKVLLQTSVTPS
jgi:hypothetical protein